MDKEQLRKEMIKLFHEYKRTQGHDSRIEAWEVYVNVREAYLKMSAKEQGMPYHQLRPLSNNDNKTHVN